MYSLRFSIDFTSFEISPKFLSTGSVSDNLIYKKNFPFSWKKLVRARFVFMITDFYLGTITDMITNRTRFLYIFVLLEITEKHVCSGFRVIIKSDYPVRFLTRLLYPLNRIKRHNTFVFF